MTCQTSLRTRLQRLALGFVPGLPIWAWFEPELAAPRPEHPSTAKRYQRQRGDCRTARTAIYPFGVTGRLESAWVRTATPLVSIRSGKDYSLFTPPETGSRFVCRLNRRILSRRQGGRCNAPLAN